MSHPEVDFEVNMNTALKRQQARKAVRGVKLTGTALAASVLLVGIATVVVACNGAHDPCPALLTRNADHLKVPQ